MLGQAGHKPERGVAPAPSHFARQDDQSPEGAVEELRVAASLLALRSAYGGTIHIGGACGGVSLPGKRANHGGVAAQSKPLRMDAIRDEVQLTLIRKVGQRDISVSEQLFVSYPGTRLTSYPGPRSLERGGAAREEAGAVAGSKVVPESINP